MPLWPAFIRRESLLGLPLIQCKNMDDTPRKKDSPAILAAPSARASARGGLAMAMAQLDKLAADLAVAQWAKLKGTAIRARESDIAERAMLRTRSKPPS